MAPRRDARGRATVPPDGQPFAEYEIDSFDMSIFTAGKPPYAEVLDVRAGRVEIVRDYLATVTTEVLDESDPTRGRPRTR